MKTITKLSLAVTIFMATVFYNKTYAQCSEAENATMKKYAELTRTGDAQGCSQCAWLANLFCIAENGLYKNDKTEVQNAISATKANIKLMGEPICCPELLTKNPKFGQQKNASTGNGNATTTTQSKTEQDIEALTNEVNAAINTIGNLNAIDQTYGQLKEEIEKIEKLMNESSLMADRIYQSEDDINSEYNSKLSNLNKLAETHLSLKTKMQNLGYSASGELLNNSSSVGLGAIALIGTVASTDKKESKTFSENAKDRLQTSKSNKLFKHKYKDSDFQLDLIENKMTEYFSKTYPEDFSNLLNNSIINGYKAGMNYKEFKKLFSKFKWKNIGPAHYMIKDYGNGSDFYFKLGLSKGDYSTVREVEQVTTYSAAFSPEKLAEYQQMILNEIKSYDNLFNIKPKSYKSGNAVSEATNILSNMSSEQIFNTIKSSNPKLTDGEIQNVMKLIGSQTNTSTSNANPINSTTTVIWTDNTNKSFSLMSRLSVKNEKITLEIKKIERNLQDLEKFKNPNQIILKSSSLKSMQNEIR